MVIAEYVVQQYLEEIWDGGLNWGAAKMTGFFFLFILFPVFLFLYAPCQALELEILSTLFKLGRLVTSLKN